MSTTKDELTNLNLNKENSIVIGSGILQALGIRKSNDIDLVVDRNVFDLLKNSEKFTLTENRGKTILQNNIFDIGTEWNVLGKSYKLGDLLTDSVVIDNVRYITLDFLYAVKKSWITGDKVPRDKDINDIKLIERYFETQVS